MIVQFGALVLVKTGNSRGPFARMLKLRLYQEKGGGTISAVGDVALVVRVVG